MVRSFEFARKVVDGKVVEEKAFESAKLPVYATKNAAGADFFAAEDVIIPSIWHTVGKFIKNLISHKSDTEDNGNLNPTIVHTGVKAGMYEDEVLEIYNRSSNPKKLGLILANSVGVIDSDYYSNSDNDGEIMFAYYNFKPWNVEIKTGDRIGQGVFKKYLRPEIGLNIAETERSGGFGSTGK